MRLMWFELGFSKLFTRFLRCSLALVFFTVVETRATLAAEGIPKCLIEIEKKFDDIESNSPVEFCRNFRAGWVFEIHPDLGHDSVLTNGTILRVFDFRQEGWEPGGENTLKIELIPARPNIFAVHFRDGEKVFRSEGNREYFLWGRDTRSGFGSFGAFGNKWNPVRFIRCLTKIDLGCITHYDVLLCKRYFYPKRPQYRPKKIEPVISVKTQTPIASDLLLDNFGEAHALMEIVLDRLLEHSCQVEH